MAYSVQRALYYYNPATGQKQIPDIAAGDPQISADNKSITVKLQKGITFSPPVNREVTSADIKYAFERCFSANVPNGYTSSYFSSIEGVPAKPTTGVTPISGIQTPD